MTYFKKVFGTRISNALFRMGIDDVVLLKQYCVDHPFNHNNQARVWRGIGPIGYAEIDKFLKKTES